MRETLTITDRLYKAVLKPDGEKPRAIARVVCAKNEQPRFIAVIDSPGKASRLVSDGSPSLGLTPAVRYRLSAEGPFEVKISPIGYLRDNDGVKASDIVFSEKSLQYEGDEYPMAACDILLPSDVSAGDYVLKIALYKSVGLNDEIKADEQTITLSVFDCTLPCENDYRFYADIWQHNSNVARTFGVALWSDAHFELIGKVLDKLKKLGQRSATVIASDCPWRGWGCYLMRDTPANLFEYNIVGVAKDKSGVFRYDFKALDRLLELYRSRGIDGDVTIYGLLGIWSMPYFDTAKVDYPEAVKIGYTDEIDGARRYMSERGEIIAYIRALFAHLKAAGIWDKVRIGADEPSELGPFFENLNVLEEIEPEIKLKVAIDKPEIIESLGSFCEDLCLSFPCTVQGIAEKRKYKRAGRRLWYVCNVPDRPNSLLDNSLAEAAALGVLNLAFGFDGLLRWAATCWTAAPLSDIRYNTNGLPAGDNCILYPAPDGGIYESQRYDALKFGVILYELLSRVEARDKKTYSRLLSSVLGEREGFFRICDGVGISVEAKDYTDLYEKLLAYAAGEGGAL